MRVWDLPLRIFHWGLMICVFAAIGSSKAGVMWAHERFGLTVLALVAFRVIWGFVGGYHARFANFVKGPLAVLRWLRQSSGQSLTPQPLACSSLSLTLVPHHMYPKPQCVP